MFDYLVILFTPQLAVALVAGVSQARLPSPPFLDLELVQPGTGPDLGRLPSMSHYGLLHQAATKQVLQALLASIRHTILATDHMYNNGMLFVRIIVILLIQSGTVGFLWFIAAR